MTAHDLSSRLLVICDRIAAGGKFDADEESHLLIEAARLLAAQPTDAQKIEALTLAADAADFGITGMRHWTQRGMPFSTFAHEAASIARKALRLLGLPTE